MGSQRFMGKFWIALFKDIAVRDYSELLMGSMRKPMKDQPLSADASPTALSPDNYDNKSSDDDNDDDVEKDEEDGEEEEHLAPADPSQQEGICWNSTSVQQVQAAPQWAMYCKVQELQEVKFQKRVDKKINTLSERQAENKRKSNNTSKNNQNQQQPNKRQNTGKAYAAWHGEKKYYGGSKPLSSTNANAVNNQRFTGASQKAICHECGNQGHYRSDCLERKNQNHENQTGLTRARGVVHALRGGETDQDPNNIRDKIEA
ncbi:reverse transcriptase domain-containing protein [Tanacetum coccineum]